MTSKIVEDDVEDDVEASRSGGWSGSWSGGWSGSWSGGWSGNGKTKCRVGGIVDKICHAIDTKRCCKSRRPHKYKHGSGNKYRIASTSESADGIEARSGDRGGDRHNKHGHYGKDKHDRDRDEDVIKACCELFESDSHSKDHDAWRAAIAEVDARTGGGKKCKPPMHKLKKLCAKISNKCCQCEIDSEYKGKTYYTHKNVEGKVCIGKKSDYDTCCDVKGTEKCCKDGRCVDKQKGCGCPDTLPGIGETCSDACGCEGDTTNCVSGTCCPDTLPGDGETCSDACGCEGDTTNCVSGTCCPDTLPGDGETCSDACGCEGDTTNCVSGTCCPDTLPGDGETCSDACGCEGDTTNCVSGTCCPDTLPGDGETCSDACGCEGDTTNCVSGTCCPDTLPGDGETCSDACGCEGDTTNCVSGTCCPDTLPGDGETCSDACGCLSGGDCVSGSCCPVPRLGSGVSCPDPFANCCEAGLDCVGSAIGGGKFCCPTALPSVGDSCTDECGCASGICCFDLASIPSNPSKKCVDEKFCPCGICLITSGKDLYGTNTAYCANDAAASESCDKSCGSCSSGNGIGLEPVPVPLISNPPSFTGDACNDANSCTSFLPDLPKGVNPNSLCPQSQICVACKAEKTSQGQGCCLASGVFHPNDPDQACPA